MALSKPTLSKDVDAVLGGAGDAGGAALIAAPGAGKKLRITAYALTLTAAGTAKFRDAAAGAGTSYGTVRASAAGQGQAEGDGDDNSGARLFDLPVNTGLFLNVSAALTVSGRISYKIVNSFAP